MKSFMPGIRMPWMYDDSPAVQRQFLQRHWRAPAYWKPESWHLPLAGEPVGMQDVWAEEFALRPSVGTEIRAAVLDLAFGLGALEAVTEYTEGNYASEWVSSKLGCASNGQRTARHDDAERCPCREFHPCRSSLVLASPG